MKKPIVFMFSGQGSQYYQMGRELYRNNAVFQHWVNICSDILQQKTGESLVDILYGQNSSKIDFDNILLSNPSLISIQYSLAKVLESHGVFPDYLLGYSLGEFTSAVYSGALTLEEGIDLTLQLGRWLAQETPPSKMLAVLGSEKITETHKTLFEKSWVTGRNFGGNFVISGEREDILLLHKELKNKDIPSFLLPVNYGFHTPLIDPIERRFKSLEKYRKFSKSTYMSLSSCTVDWVSDYSFELLWRVIREPVSFERTLRTMLMQGDYTFIDVGPSGTLATFVKYIVSPEDKTDYYEMMNPYGNNAKTLGKLLASVVGEHSLGLQSASVS